MVWRLFSAQLKPGLWLLPLAWLWFQLVDNLHVEWSLNPQYAYGWAVPFLCVYLIWQRLEKPVATTTGTGCNRVSLILIVLALAVLYAPIRLVEEANPDWRLVSWLLAVDVVGITLAMIALTSGISLLKQVAFAICFFLVAVPWPTVIEVPVIQALARATASVTVQLLVVLGIPAVQHGNVIEVATGIVGIDEACSGIRSVQATLMIALFFGELFKLNIGRRIFCVAAGFALAFLFNIIRTSLLVSVASSRGIPAIAAWHDPAGIAILVACFCSLWVVAGILRGKRSLASETQSAERTKPGIESDVGISRLRQLAVGLCVWLALTESSVEWWYRSHEMRLAPAETWSVAWPTNNPSFKKLSFAERTRRILRYDEGRDFAWGNPDGTRWQVFYLRWKAGRTALHLARNHTPEVCLTATGRKVTSESKIEWFDVHGLQMPFRQYEVTDPQAPLHVFYCLWNDRANEQGFETMALTYGNRLGAVLAGLRNPGQRSIEISVWGFATAAEAEAAVRHELPDLIVVKGTNAS